jgi:hypothetical protein
MGASARSWLPGLALVGLLAVLLASGGADPRTLLMLLVVPAVLLGLQHHAGWSRRARGAFAGFLGLTTAVAGVPLVATVRANLRRIPEWDFLGFWLHARTAVAGRSFYDPRSAQEWVSTLSVSRAFRREIVDVGFWYPPPSMFLFWPLGWFDRPAALALWYAFHVVVLGVDVVLLWKIFFPRGKSVELAACAALVCLAHGTLLTFHFAQTNFVALLAVLLFWPRRETAWGGLWAAVAVLVKPFLAVLALDLLVRARWRALAGLLAATTALVLASVVAFGPRTFADYLAGDPLAAKPDWIYDEPTNQSLLGWILRTTGTECSGTGCVAHPAFLAAAAAVGGITLALGIGLARAHADWALALYLLCGLLVYPVSQLFYSVLLIPPVLLAWSHRAQIGGGAWTVAALAGAVYALCALENGRATVAAYGLLWAAMALVATGWVTRASPPRWRRRRPARPA